jgi:DtxR family Mn-dependent transcriptional regulator
MPETDTPTRDHSRAVEDYVKQIYKLTQAGDKATTKALADRMGLGQGTVSGMIRQLAQRGLVEHQPYYGARLTEQGHQLAMRMIRRHRLIELFLVRTLGLAWEEVDHDAERLEHAVSDRVVQRIDEVLGHPDVDPHGAPIPSATGRIHTQNFRILAELEPGETATIRRVADDSAELLQYLSRHGIGLHDAVEVTDAGPYGAITLRIGRRTLHLPREAAEKISVSAEPA